MAALLASLQARPLGNASSVHRFGVRAARVLEEARMGIAARIGAAPEEILFTSGGTESNALAILGYARAQGNSARKTVLISSIEHPSVASAARTLAAEGFRCVTIPVDAEGRVRIEEFERMLGDDSLLVSVMHANNEVGTVQDLGEIGRLSSERGIPFHSDACQSFGKIPLDVRRDRVDLLSISSHKIHGPRGIGALYVRKGIRIAPLFSGGGQEGGLRGGTSAVELAAAFALAAKRMEGRDVAAMEALRDTLIRELRERFPRCVINGSLRHRLCNNVNVSFPGVDAKQLLFALDKRGISVSAGSACASGKKTASPVLLAMGRGEADASQSLRISLAKTTTAAELGALVDALAELLESSLRPGAPARSNMFA